MTSVARRLRALILALVFLGGGTSLPSFDTLLFHLHGEASQTTAAHVESSTDACASHVGHCGIGCPASATGALAAHAGTPLLFALQSSSSLRSSTGFQASHAWRLGFDSRAPPIQHA